jgi:gliding motility-associated protein GldL
MSDITEATVATSQYASNMKSAANTVGTLSNTFTQSASSLQDSIGTLSTSYASLSSTVKNDISSITESTKNYGSQLDNVNKNLAALNTVYELQLRDSNTHLKESQSLYGGLNLLLDNLKQSADETQKYRTEISQLSQNLSSLNTIYGNMLAAMNVITKK